jgi:hypothetical protein
MYKKKDRIIDVHSGFTKDAMAGLAAKEDYTSVKLKNSCLVNHSGEYPSFSDLMLLHIKGRRYCQVRMVEPRVESLNNGDCFILVTPLHLFLLLGEHANIIEKSKANEIFDWISDRKDLGLNKLQSKSSIIDCKHSLIFKTMLDDGENENSLTPTEQEFLSILTKNSSLVLDPERFQQSDKDETYEQLITQTNRAYKVVLREDYESTGTTSDDSNEENEPRESKYDLEPLSEYWGKFLRLLRN